MAWVFQGLPRLIADQDENGELVYGSTASYVYLGDNYVASLSASIPLTLTLVSRINGASTNIVIAANENNYSSVLSGPSGGAKASMARLSDGRIAIVYGLSWGGYVSGDTALYALIVEKDGSINAPAVRFDDLSTSNDHYNAFNGLELVPDASQGGFWITYSAGPSLNKLFHFSSLLSQLSNPIITKGNDIIYGDIDGIRVASSADSLIRRYDNNGSLTAETAYDPSFLSGNIRFNFKTTTENFANASLIDQTTTRESLVNRGLNDR